MAAARSVSIIVPCRNEAAHIDAFCTSVSAQRLPADVALEVVIADGGSDDGTRERLQAWAARDPRWVVVDNPEAIVSCGLNRALERARGDVIVRMDVHTEYADDYVQQCLAALERSGADNVGGPWRALGDTPVQRAIAAAFQSRWVAGGARSRDLGYEGEVDTVYLGCWPRRTFERFGAFDEELVRNQDDEHNLRIVRGSGRVWQSARIRSRYRPRATLAALFRQYLQYGYWKPFVMRKHGQAAAPRQVVPGVFVAVLAAAALTWLLGGPAAPPLVLAGSYVATVAVLSLLVARTSGWDLLPRLPLVIAAYHLGYGIGSVLGWVDVLSGREAGRSRFARLTR